MGLRMNLIVVALCIAAGLGRAGEDLKTLKADLLSLKLRVTPLSYEQMAPAGAKSHRERTADIAHQGPERLFPVPPEGVRLGCVAPTGAASSRDGLPAWLASVDQNALFALWDRAWEALGRGAHCACRPAPDVPSAAERLSADRLLGALRIAFGVERVAPQPRDAQTAMVNRAWRF